MTSTDLRVTPACSAQHEGNQIAVECACSGDPFHVGLDARHLPNPGDQRFAVMRSRPADESSVDIEERLAQQLFLGTGQQFRKQGR